jgi:hypothetical protein
MKGLFPNEFPFSPKRKTTRRKTAKPTATERAGAAETTLSVVDLSAAAPAVDAAATIESVLAEATPAVVAAAAEVAPAAVVEVPAAPVVVAVAPVAPVASAAPAAAPKAVAPVAAIPVRVAGHATSRASLTPAVSTIEPARAADARAADGYGGPERRRSPRQALRAKAMYRNDLNPAAAGPVQILNFSMCGVRLWSNRPMKSGERGNVKMEIGPVKWSGRVKVVTCESHDDDGFAVGCEFAANEMARRVA